MRTFVRIAVVAALATFPLTAKGQVGHHCWTGCPSTAAIEDATLLAGGAPLYNATNCALRVQNNAPANASVVARMNVVNTFDNNANPDMPGWTVMKLGYNDVDGSVVQATLYRVISCTGAIDNVCTITSASDGNGVCGTCNAAALGPIDFSTYLYYIVMRVTDTGANSNPSANTLRLCAD